MHSINPRILTHHDLISTQDIDGFLNYLNQQPVYKRRKLLNSHSKINSYPHFIYKYLPLKSTDIDDHKKFLRDYLVESRLWLSSPSKFNDPFDMKCQYIFEGIHQDKRKFLEAKFQQFFPDISEHVRKERISDILAFDDVPKVLNKIYENEINQYGVCCFSKNARNILMWAHYGSEHKGVSLQFQTSRDIFIFSRVTKVKYSHKYPTINYLEDNLGSAITKTIRQKSKNWKYEKERRLVHPTGADSYLQFNPSALTALILGCKLEFDSEEIIKSLLRERMQKNYPPLKIFRATQDNKEYKIRIKRVSNFS